jgi:hypothetical protein
MSSANITSLRSFQSKSTIRLSSGRGPLNTSITEPAGIMIAVRCSPTEFDCERREFQPEAFTSEHGNLAYHEKPRFYGRGGTVRHTPAALVSAYTTDSSGSRTTRIEPVKPSLSSRVKLRPPGIYDVREARCSVAGVPEGSFTNEHGPGCATSRDCDSAQGRVCAYAPVCRTVADRCGTGTARSGKTRARARLQRWSFNVARW